MVRSYGRFRLYRFLSIILLGILTIALGISFECLPLLLCLFKATGFKPARSGTLRRCELFTQPRPGLKKVRSLVIIHLCLPRLDGFSFFCFYHPSVTL
jgi:hypothetical protein